MDFYRISTRDAKGGMQELYPDFTVGRSKDLMVQGRSFFAIWDEETKLWSTDEYDVQRLVDAELAAYAQQENEKSGISYNVKYLSSFGSNGWSQFRKFLNNISDSSHPLDSRLTFANTETKKNDYVSKKLPYALEPGDYSAWDELMGTLYSVEEREKIEWAIGAVVSGDSKKIQKFIVLYGPAGTGKSTVLNIIQKLFEGYTTSFEAKALGSNNNAFATEVFKSNPLVALQHDGDLSKIEDNTKLNSIISHEDMTMNEKFKPSYTSRIHAFLFMGTNQPVKISDAKSGIIRRLIDVHPTGVKIPANHYHALMSRIDFELGAIASHCLDVYRELGKNHYNAYRPLEMMLQTDIFFNYVEANYDVFKAQDGVSLRQAYTLYKEFCSDTGIEKPLPQYKVREELRNYFDDFKDRHTVDGVVMRSYYTGFSGNKFKAPAKEVNTFSLVLEETASLLDDMLKDQPAQYANANETPMKKWEYVKSTLSVIDTTRLHYVKVPENHIVIDFDLKGEDGGKSLERNLEAASAWPATYAELSKSGAGVHLHYNYTGGDVTQLSTDYSDGIEVKHYRGDAALRRRVLRCNGVAVSDLSTGLPVKEHKVLSATTIQSERGLRDLIGRNLRKEIHSGTKSSVDFIYKILSDANEDGMAYDLTDMRPAVLAFANNSSNQALAALQVVQKMPFSSAGDAGLLEPDVPEVKSNEKIDDRLAIFDVEVYPNLFVICWKFKGADNKVVSMINPSVTDIEHLLKLKLVGFNNRRYDNHMLYAAFLGYSNEQLYNLSQKIINSNGGPSPLFGEAYNLSYTDIFDYLTKKQGLKKWEIELGIHHLELDLPWDQPVDPEVWDKVVEYCTNDVLATEAVMDANEQDLLAREILAELSGLTCNHTTQQHTAKIVFGGDKNPQGSFVYTHLDEEFPGYVFDMGKSMYRDELVGEGGYVYAEPGIYKNVALLDIASMHPTTIENLNLFGEYTQNFSDLKRARMAIKHGDYDAVVGMLGGKLGPHLLEPAKAKALSDALKLAINTVYGLTSAKFDNPFRDPRNKDNIVAKRGALFMIDLKHAVQEMGYTVAHIKTDSIKIPDADWAIIDFVTSFGEKYGYDFELEETYDKLCLVNEAVYVARKGDKYTAVGAQFQQPYVFKTLFSKEELSFKDYCETKSVNKGHMYLDFDLDRPMINPPEGMHFVGRTGQFVPVIEGYGGGVLYRVQDGKQYAVTGTKGYLWIEAEIARDLETNGEINGEYFEKIALNAINTIEKFGSYADFIS